MSEVKTITSFNPGPDDSEGEESFVVLGNSMVPGDSLLPSYNSSLNNMSISSKVNNVQMISSAASLPATPQLMSQHFSADEVSGNTMSSEFKPEDIQQKLNFLVEENIKLKKTLDQNNMVMKKQVETLAVWQEDVMKVHQSHKEKFAETKKFIENLKAEKTQLENKNNQSAITIEKLQEEIKVLQSHKIELDKMKAQNQCLIQSSLENVNKFELSVAQKKATELEILVTELRRKLNLSEENLQISRAQIELMTTEITNLHRENNEVRLEISKQKKQNELIKESLENDLMSLRLENSQTKCIKGCEKVEQTIAELTSTKEQLMMAQIKITDLETQAFHAVENNTKDEDIKRLEKLVKELTAENENMSVLKAQVEIYRQDFEAERNARSALADEKDQIAGDLTAMQRRNQQLLEEVENLRKDRVPNYRQQEVNSSLSSPASATSARAESNTATRYKFECPKCQFLFRDYTSLENHVHRCIELDDIF